MALSSPARKGPSRSRSFPLPGNGSARVPSTPASGYSPAIPASARKTDMFKTTQGGSRVKVLVRVRPFLQGRELRPTKQHPSISCVVAMEDSRTVLMDPAHEYIHKEEFQFDKCFWSLHEPPPPGFHKQYDSQLDVYTCVGQELLDNAFEGFNTCLFAYGQTSSGKTYTMMGNINDWGEKGIIPRLCEDVFARLRNEQLQNPSLTFKVEASYYEIYNEKVRDLLQPERANAPELRVRQHPTQGPFIEALSSHSVADLTSTLRLIAIGAAERTTAATSMNDRSSRSHAIFSIVLTSTQLPDGRTTDTVGKVSKINLVDLAGSERTNTTDNKHFKETTSINLSLTTLGRVIEILSDRKSNGLKHPPYRDSLLTWLLSESLGGNSKTVMISAISPAPCNYEETQSTLRYASRARSIINQAHVNHTDEAATIKELRDEIDSLRFQLQSFRDEKRPRKIDDVTGITDERARKLLEENHHMREQSLVNEIAAKDWQDKFNTLFREYKDKRMAWVELEARAKIIEGFVSSKEKRELMEYVNGSNIIQSKADMLKAEQALLQLRGVNTDSAIYVRGDQLRIRELEKETAELRMQVEEQQRLLQQCDSNLMSGRTKAPAEAHLTDQLHMLETNEKVLRERTRARQSEIQQKIVTTSEHYLNLQTKILDEEREQRTRIRENGVPSTPHLSSFPQRYSTTAQSLHSPTLLPPATFIGSSPPPTPHSGRPFFGIEIDVNGVSNGPEGVLVRKAFGPAAECGILEGDIVTQVGQKKICNKDELKKALSDYLPHQVVEIYVRRRESLYRMKLTVGMG